MGDGAEDWEWNDEAESAPKSTEKKETKKEDLTKSSKPSIGDDDKKNRLRQACLHEIVDSEVKYLRDLYTLTLYYVTPLRGDVGKKFPELFSAKNGAVTVLFSTIELIFDGNTELNDKLRNELTSNTPMFGAVFLNQIEKLCQYYGVFCNHQKEAMLQIEELLKSLPAFKQFEDSCKAQPEVNNLGVLDFLVKPFQRLLKYPLLLNELLKNTPEDSPDRPNILQAIQKLQAEVDLINTNKAKSDNMKKVIDLNQQIEQLPRGFKLLIPSRRFVFDGTLQKISGNHDQERHFFLFNDCLVYCKKKGPNKYLCRGVIYLNQLKLEDTGDPVSFKIFRTDKNLTYVLYGASKREKDVWMHEIKACQQTTNVLSRSRSLTDVGKKEIIRVFTDERTFKSIAGTGEMTFSELAAECLRKLGSKDNAEDYVIVARIKDKEITQNSGDFPLQSQTQFIKQGIKFGNDVNHFKLVKAADAPLPSSAAPLLRSMSPDSKSREELRATMRSKNNISSDNLKSPIVVTTPAPKETPKEESSSPPSTLVKANLTQSVSPARPNSKPVEPQRALSPAPQRPQLPPPPRPLSPPPPRPLSPSPQRAVSPPPQSYESNVPRLASKAATNPANNRPLSPPPAPPKPANLTIPRPQENSSGDRNSNNLMKSTGPKNLSASLSPPPQRPPSTKTTATTPSQPNNPTNSNPPRNLRAYHSTLKRPANPMEPEEEGEKTNTSDVKRNTVKATTSPPEQPKSTPAPAKQTPARPAPIRSNNTTIYATTRPASGSSDQTPNAPVSNPGGATMRPQPTPRNLNRPLPPPPPKTKTM